MNSISEIIIKEIELDEDALSLVWNVFLEFESPDYSEEGVEMFRNILHDSSYLKQLSMHGAYCDGKLVGAIATRENNSHIALFFVDGKYHKKGIGCKLFESAKSNCKKESMTVHSSPFAVPVYMKLGFKQVDEEQEENGLRFTPMVMYI